MMLPKKENVRFLFVFSFGMFLDREQRARRCRGESEGGLEQM